MMPKHQTRTKQTGLEADHGTSSVLSVVSWMGCGSHIVQAWVLGPCDHSDIAALVPLPGEACVRKVR